MKLFFMWVVHIAIIFGFVIGTMSFIKADKNYELKLYPSTVVKKIQEDHEVNSSYYIIFKLPNGSYLDQTVARITYGSLEVGQVVNLELNKYDAKEETKKPRRFGEVILILCTFLYIIFGTQKLIGESMYG